MTYYVAIYTCENNHVIGVFDNQEEAECACKVEVTRYKGWRCAGTWQGFAKIEKVKANTIDYVEMWNDLLKSITVIENR